MSGFGLSEEYTMYNIQGLSIVVSVSAEMKLIQRVVVL
jgi:hypothetical protein